jgi:hypothetical protein
MSASYRYHLDLSGDGHHHYSVTAGSQLVHAGSAGGVAGNFQSQPVLTEQEIKRALGKCKGWQDLRPVLKLIQEHAADLARYEREDAHARLQELTEDNRRLTEDNRKLVSRTLLGNAVNSRRMNRVCAYLQELTDLATSYTDSIDVPLADVIKNLAEALEEQ